MEIDVGAYIADLLYDHESVNLPGLGSFVGKYQAATIDHVQGKLHPPAKSLAFNSNLVLDDGVLVSYLQQKHHLSVEAAQKTVKDFIAGVQEALNRKEIVIFPKLGQIYQDYEGKVKFVPEGTNFNKDAYGLPPVQFYPLSRIEGRPTTGSTTPPKEKKPVKPVQEKQWTKNIEHWFDRNIVMIIAASVIFIAFIGYWFFLRNPRAPEISQNQEPMEEVPNDRFNVSPSQLEEQNTAAGAEETEGAVSSEPEAETQAGSQNVDTEEPTLAPGQKVAVIGIGVFKSKENVGRLVQKIYEAGFEPYTKAEGDLTRVGVQMAYQNESELQRALREVQNKFEPKAKIIQR